MIPLLLTACNCAPGTPDGPATHDSAVDDGFVQGLSVTPGVVVTALTVTWTTAAPSRATVTGSFGEDSIIVTEADLATDHSVLLVGFPALTEVDVRVEATAEDGTTGTAETTITTEALPTWLPDVTYTADEPDASEGGFVVVPVVDGSGGMVAVYDHAGRAVWAWPPEEADKSASVVRGRLSLDGEAIVYNSMAPSVDESGPLTRVSLDGSSVEIIDVTAAHTDFVEIADHTYAALGWDLREIGDRKILGETILEIAPDGTIQEVWSVWDEFYPDLNRTYDSWYPADSEVESWSHINGIAYDAAEDCYYVTSTWNDGVIRVDRASGTMDWYIDGNGGDFAYEGGGTPVMVEPHSVQPIDGGLLVFSRGEPHDTEACSEAVEIELDTDAMTVARGATWASEECILVTYLGSAQRLPGGNTLITWTTAGQVDEWTPDGALTWRINSAIGAGFGFSSRVERLGLAEQ